MQGGLASLGIVERNLAAALIGKDPLDHAVLLDALLHTFAKLGPEGTLSGALAALDIALWDLKEACSTSGSISSSAALGAPACRFTRRSAAMASAASTRCRGLSNTAQRQARSGEDPLRQRPDQPDIDILTPAAIRG